MTDLTEQTERHKLSLRIAEDAEAWSQQAFPSERRNHLGASEIGHPCKARAWGKFRWLKLEQRSGRMSRLFERGHLEEARFVRILRGIGFDVREFAENGNQFKISGANGHFGGSLDDIAMPPESYGLTEPLLLEFKTHGEKSFAKLKKDGVFKAKPIHYAQMCSYGRAYGFHYALYVAVNKNTDELHFEIVKLDWLLADDLFRKADEVISSQEQPVKIAQTETYFECKYCHLSGICFRGEKPEKNCRSCSNCFPIANGNWRCAIQDDDALEPEEIAEGCSKWRAIINADKEII